MTWSGNVPFLSKRWLHCLNYNTVSITDSLYNTFMKKKIIKKVKYMSNLMWQKERTFSCNIDFCRVAFDHTALQPRKKDLQCSLNELFLCFIKVHIWRNNKHMKKVNVFDFFKIGFWPFLTLPEPLCVGSKLFFAISGVLCKREVTLKIANFELWVETDFT